MKKITEIKIRKSFDPLLGSCLYGIYQRVTFLKYFKRWKLLDYDRLWYTKEDAEARYLELIDLDKYTK